MQVAMEYMWVRYEKCMCQKIILKINTFILKNAISKIFSASLMHKIKFVLIKKHAI